MLQESEFEWTAERGLNFAAERAVLNHLPLARKLGSQFAKRSGLPMDDMIAAATLGLMEAATGFDPARGNAFATYSTPTIRNALLDYTAINARPVQISSRERTLFYRLRAEKALLNVYGDLASHPDETAKIALKLSASTDDVLAMDGYFKPEIRLDAAAPGDDGSASATLLDRVRADGADPETLLLHEEETHQRRGLLKRALAALTDRERVIIEARHGEDKPAKLADLAHRFGVSIERIRQIETAAIDKIAQIVRKAAGDKTKPDDLPWSRDGNDNRARRHVSCRFTSCDPIPVECEPLLFDRLKDTASRAHTDRAAARARKDRAIAAGLSWASEGERRSNGGAR